MQYCLLSAANLSEVLEKSSELKQERLHSFTHYHTIFSIIFSSTICACQSWHKKKRLENNAKYVSTFLKLAPRTQRDC